MTRKTILLFIVSATLLTLLSGWLMVANLLPIQAAAIDYSEFGADLAPGSDRDWLALAWSCLA